MPPGCAMGIGERTGIGPDNRGLPPRRLPAPLNKSVKFVIIKLLRSQRLPRLASDSLRCLAQVSASMLSSFTSKADELARVETGSGGLGFTWTARAFSAVDNRSERASTKCRNCSRGFGD